MNNDGLVNLNECRDALARRRQEAFQVQVNLYGSEDGWFDVCRNRTATDRDHQLALSIVRILRHRDQAKTPSIKRHWRNLDTDPALAAYWRSVSEAGRDGWHEERERVKAVEVAALKADDPAERRLALNLPAIKSLLPVYRIWGTYIQKNIYV